MADGGGHLWVKVSSGTHVRFSSSKVSVARRKTGSCAYIFFFCRRSKLIITKEFESELNVEHGQHTVVPAPPGPGMVQAGPSGTCTAEVHGENLREAGVGVH